MDQSVESWTGRQDMTAEIDQEGAGTRFPGDAPTMPQLPAVLPITVKTTAPQRPSC